MWPHIKKHGWKYFFDADFRHKMVNLRNNRKRSLASKKLYGKKYNVLRPYRIKALLERDGNNCSWCGEPLGNDITIDHIDTRRNPKFGSLNNGLSNLRLMHANCNVLRGALLDKQLRKK